MGKKVKQLKAQLLGNNEQNTVQSGYGEGSNRSSSGGKVCMGLSLVLIILLVTGCIVIAALSSVITVAAMGGFKHEDQSCLVNACSESQGPGNSNNDGGTNMCNMQNLFCNRTATNEHVAPYVSCAPIKTNLQYEMVYKECGRYKGNNEYAQHDCQDFERTCLIDPPMSSPTTSDLLTDLRRRVDDALGGAQPPDYPHDDFVKFDTCPGSPHTTHTMAQQTMKFSNSCADVANEILARANGMNGWQDPHNRGQYTVVQAISPDLIIITRLTGNNKYTDKMTFHLQEA